MIIEVRVEYHDGLDNSLFEVLEIPVSENDNIEVLIADEVNHWFFTVAEELFNDFWDSETDEAKKGLCYEYAFETYLNNVEMEEDYD
jgi:hypothetical protein